MKIGDYIPGFVIVLAIAFFSYFISTLNASFDPLVVSIIVGMLTGNLIGEKEYFGKGSEGAIKIFLPVGIALYGTQLVFDELKFGLIFSIFLVFICLFGLTLIVSRVLNIDRKIAVLLASGLSICGASAIAVISPLVGAKKEDTSISIISVMMLGLVGMIFYPMLYEFFSLTRDEYNFFTGTTLPMLGQVKVAAGSVCPECLNVAMKIKLVRISFLLFVVSVAVFLSGKEEKKIKIPWFIVGFILFAFLGNFTKLLAHVLEYFKASSAFFLSAALAAIGFSVDFDSIVEKGVTPLAALFISWGVVILLIYIIKNLF